MLPASDSTQISSLPDPPAALVPLPDLGAQVTPQARPDTTEQAAPDTTTTTPDSLSEDTLSARVQTPPLNDDDDPMGEVSALLEGATRELQKMQEGITRQMLQFQQTFTLTRLLLAILALALTYLLVRVAIWSLERLAHWRPAQAYRIQRMIPFVRFAVWFMALWIILGSLFAGSTLVLILLMLLVVTAVGVTLFQFLRDLIGGLVLTFEQPFQIGSRITVGDHAGLVKKIGLRSFEMAQPDGTLVIVPNAEVLRTSITAIPSGVPEAPISVELPVPATVDVEQAQARIREAVYASPYCCAAKPTSIVLTAPDASDETVQFRVEAYVFDARYASALTSDLLRFTREHFAALKPATASED
jgi:small-conductance mechanosensitive channel